MASPSFSFSDFKTRRAVLEKFYPIMAKFEGETRFMYADSKGLITTGVGNLIDPVTVALQLTWYKPDGSVATPAEVTAEWWKVKNAYPAVQSFADAKITSLRLRADDVATLVKRRILDNELAMLPTYSKYGEYPADGQFALLRMAWAGGPGMVTRTFTKMRDAILKTPPDFLTAALNSKFKDWSESDARNVFVKTLFLNADTVVKQGLDPSVLYYPEAPKSRGLVRAPSVKEGLVIVAVAGAAAAGIVYKDEIKEVVKKLPEKVKRLRHA